jgi:hypothetical protein
MVTIVASSTTISCASPTTPRIHQRRADRLSSGMAFRVMGRLLVLRADRAGLPVGSLCAGNF